MNIPPNLRLAQRQAHINLIDAAGAAGWLSLYTVSLPVDGALPPQAPICRIRLAHPCGVADEAGIALAVTEYAQVKLTGNVIAGRIEDAIGTWCGDVVAGLATDTPAPELQLPVAMLRAGAFVRLVGSRIDSN